MAAAQMMNPRSAPARPSRDGEAMDTPRRKRTVKMHPAVTIVVLFVLPAAAILVFVSVWLSRADSQSQAGAPPPPGPTPLERFERAKKAASKKVHAALAVMNSEDVAMVNERYREATAAVGAVIDDLNRFLEERRDEDDEAPERFEDYRVLLAELATMIADLLKSQPSMLEEP